MISKSEQNSFPHPLTSKWLVGVFSSLMWMGMDSVQATEIRWNSTILLPFVPTTNQQSNGSNLDQSFLFSLGTFVSGFTPTSANTSSWATNWRRLDLASYNLTSRAFVGNASYGTNTAPFLTTARGYIWGYNGACGAGEWILITNNAWTFPQGSTDIGAPIVDWVVSAGTAGLTTIVGNLNGSGYLMKTESVGASVPQSTTGAAWKALYFPNDLANPAVSGWTADPDGDGMNNLYEYSIGTSPTVFNLPIIPTVTKSGNSLVSLLQRDCRASVLWTIKESSTLGAWNTIGGDVTLEPDNSTGYRVTVPFTGPKRFIRYELFTTP